MSEENPNSGTITIRKDSLWKYFTFLLLAIVIIGGFVAFRGGGGSPTGNVIAPTVPTQPTAPTQPSQVRVSIGDAPVLGNPDAPVTIVEFSDFQCPFCGRFYSDALASIKTQYIETGKVKFVYKDFPLVSIHPMAQPTAEAARCARAQGGDDAFWKYHDKIFENQAALSTTTLKQWAKDLGYNIDSCLDSGEMRSVVQQDLAEATAAGGQGTPYIVVISGDGSTIPISGAQPFSVFQQAIEASL
ncbi:DsbA family protein [Candidatus Pacearchaeota archaeon]|nr:DsbA family protein [Candidatus Pacearchaeota archaeon]